MRPGAEGGVLSGVPRGQLSEPKRGTSRILSQDTDSHTNRQNSSKSAAASSALPGFQLELSSLWTQSSSAAGLNGLESMVPKVPFSFRPVAERRS